jgi:hypothetical protein
LIISCILHNCHWGSETCFLCISCDCAHNAFFGHQFARSILFPCCRDAAEALPASLNGVPDGALHQQMISDVPDAGHALPPAAEAATGWAEQGMQIDDQGVVAQDDMVAAKFKPGIKFKLGM